MRHSESGQTESNLRFAIVVIILIALFLWAGHWLWLKLFLLNADTAVRRLGRGISPVIASGQPLDSSIYRNFIAQEPRVGYVVVANYRSGYRHGLTNLNALQSGSEHLLEDLKRIGEETMLTRLVQPGAGFPGEYLHVVSAAFVPPGEEDDATPIGLLKVGFVVPGHEAGLPPFGRGFKTVIWIWLGVTGMLCAGLVAFGLIRRPSGHHVLPIESESELEPALSKEPVKADDISWLEGELEKEEKFFIDHEGQSWRVLFDGTDLAAWKTDGDLYVSEGEICLRPWGTSAVYQHALGSSPYLFRIYGRKVAGADGFVVLFSCEGHALAWIVGGWRNQRSEVAGYPSTGKECRIEKNRWYQLDVRVGADHVEGLIDDVVVWKMNRSGIEKASPDVGFQSGLGVAVWNTLVRFRDARYQKI